MEQKTETEKVVLHIKESFPETEQEFHPQPKQE